MATILGFDTDAFSRTINEGSQDYRQGMVKSITDLGSRVSEIIERKATNSQLQNMSQDLRGLDIRSESFPLEMIDVVSRYPLAVKDKRGQLALGILGAAHKNHLTRSTGGASPWSALPGVPGTLFNRKTAEQKKLDVVIPEKPEPTKVVQTPTGYDVINRSGEIVTSRDLPAKIAKAESIEQAGQKKLALQELGAARQIASTQLEALNRPLNQIAKEAKAEGSALNERVWTQDGKWYKATPQQIENGRAGKEDFQTEIDESEAKRLLNRNKRFEDLNSGIENIQNQLMQLDERMNSMLAPAESLESSDQLFGITDKEPTGGIPTLTNKAQFDALPSGSEYIRNGKRYRKP